MSRRWRSCMAYDDTMHIHVDSPDVNGRVGWNPPNNSQCYIHFRWHCRLHCAITITIGASSKSCHFGIFRRRNARKQIVFSVSASDSAVCLTLARHLATQPTRTQHTRLLVYSWRGAAGRAARGSFHHIITRTYSCKELQCHVVINFSYFMVSLQCL